MKTQKLYKVLLRWHEDNDEYSELPPAYVVAEDFDDAAYKMRSHIADMSAIQSARTWIAGILYQNEVLV